MPCSLYDDGTRLSCALADAAYRPPPLPPLPLSAARALVHGGRSVYFVGDSLSAQHFRAFACMLEPLVAGPHHGSRIAGNLGQRLNCVKPSAPRAGSICAIRLSVPIATSELLRRGLSSGDVVVLNEGVYVRSDADGGLQRELDHVGKALRDTNLAALRASGALVLWRETLAQHFPTASGLYAKPGLGIDPARSLIQGSCRPLRDASVATRANSAVTNLVRSFNVSVLRAFSTSAERWDEHIDRHSEYARNKNSTDCTHFCEPSSLMATLNGELLAAVRRFDRSKS